MLRHLLYPLLPYRSMVFPFLVLCAITIPCWLLFRLYRGRSSERQVSFPRELLLLVFVVYLSGLAAATLEPNRGSRAAVAATDGLELRPDLASLTCSSASLPTESRARGFCVRNARGNFALFVPLGILLPLVGRRLRFGSALLIATAISVGIELAQYLTRPWSNRLADVNDVILNVLGACLGLALVYLLHLRQGTRRAIARA
ncbi:MAG: VanZ family protein [Gemmatimonadetes bacterium]|jgi:glycopeptide antibiotics resistance protein|nr:VanZ family protein [Gemmatimonadota bacterium]